MDSDLVRAQHKFFGLVTSLFVWLRDNDYQVRFGEAWRTPQQAAWNEAHHLGIALSVHMDRLALDLLISGGPGGDPYAAAGAYWKSLDPQARWGGDFKAYNDVFHFSLAYGGRA